MNTKSTIRALEGTHSGDVMGGSCGPGKTFGRFLFEGLYMAKIRKRDNSYQIGYFDPTGTRVRKSFKKRKEAEAEPSKRVSLIALSFQKVRSM